MLRKCKEPIRRRAISRTFARRAKRSSLSVALKGIKKSGRSRKFLFCCLVDDGHETRFHASTRAFLEKSGLNPLVGASLEGDKEFFGFLRVLAFNSFLDGRLELTKFSCGFGIDSGVLASLTKGLFGRWHVWHSGDRDKW